MPLMHKTSAHIIVEMCRRRRAGEIIKAIAFDLGATECVVAKYVAHLPRDRAKDEARRLAILTGLDAGLGVRDIVERVGCAVGDVVRVVRAMNSEIDALEEVEASRAFSSLAGSEA